jgi:hypothetical protein
MVIENIFIKNAHMGIFYSLESQINAISLIGLGNFRQGEGDIKIQDMR